MLKWRNSCIGRYKILEVDQKKYLVDTLHTKPRFLLFATSPDTVKFSIAEIDIKNTIFDKEETGFKFGTLLAVLITQPIAGVLYKFGKKIFEAHAISEHIFLKISLFILSIIVSTFAFTFISQLDKKKFETMAGKEAFSDQLVVYPKGQKNYLIVSMLIILSIIGILYLKTNNSFDSGFLYIASIVTFGFLIFARYIPQSNYKDLSHQINSIQTNLKE